MTHQCSKRGYRVFSRVVFVFLSLLPSGGKLDDAGLGQYTLLNFLWSVGARGGAPCKSKTGARAMRLCWRFPKASLPEAKAFSDTAHTIPRTFHILPLSSSPPPPEF